MNLANKLTIIRICLVPFFTIFVLIDNLYARIFALIIFIAGSITDTYDGYIARKQNIVTDFGKFTDPLADKLLVSAAFICFVGIKELSVPAWMVVFIISREFIITGLRTLAASNDQVIAADETGKIKTTLQMITIVIVLCIMIANSVLKTVYNVDNNGFILVLNKIPYWLVLLVTIVTVYSGISYIVKHRSLLDIKK